MAKFTVCIVDDVREEAEDCVKYLQNIPEIGEIHILTNPFLLQDLVRTTTIDILFMDVKMPIANGFEIYGSLPHKNRPVLVLMTWHDEYALTGFKYDAADYIVKPVDFPSISNAVAKALKYLKISFTVYNIPDREYAYYLDRRGVRQAVFFKDVICVEGDGNYSLIHMRGGVTITTRRKIYEIAQDAPSSSFERIHQSFLVNLKFVSKWDKHGMHVPELPDLSPLPVSRLFKAAVIKRGS